METRKWSSYGAKRAEFLSSPIPAPRPSIPPSTLGMQSVDGSSLTAALLRKEGKRSRGLEAGGLGLGLGAAQAPAPSGKTRLLGSPPREQAARSCRLSGDERRVPEVHYPVTLCLSPRAGSPVISPEAL